jgi:hypothetical protein
MLLVSKSITKLLFALILAALLSQPMMVGATSQTTRAATLSDFVALFDAQGIAIAWQATDASVDWQFTLYRSQNCQFDGAQEVTAPVFSSINSDTKVAHYSLTDADGPVVATCAYWLVATENDGDKQHFGPYEVQGRNAIYLPITLR